jgi:signal transduction histidine kinase
VVVTDLQNDPLWRDYQDLAAKSGMRACWSQPIISSSGQLLGTFALYYRTPRGPDKGEIELIEQAASLAALAIERHHEEEMMRHTERLASLGTLAAGLAHEINNPLAGIQLAVERAAHALEKGKIDRLRTMLENIASDTERCAKIVRGVLQFGRRDRAEEQPLSLSQILSTALELTKGYASERRASMEFEGPAEDVRIMARPVELEQVFVNIIRNAIEAKERGARVKVQVNLDRDSACVSVTDDGRGMSPEQKERIFDPFFTTRQSEGGTGLGLSIVHGIVSAHGGTIHVESKPHKGTTVIVCLPRYR